MVDACWPAIVGKSRLLPHTNPEFAQGHCFDFSFMSKFYHLNSFKESKNGDVSIHFWGYFCWMTGLPHEAGGSPGQEAGGSRKAFTTSGVRRTLANAAAGLERAKRAERAGWNGLFAGHGDPNMALYSL